MVVKTVFGKAKYFKIGILFVVALFTLGFHLFLSNKFVLRFDSFRNIWTESSSSELRHCNSERISPRVLLSEIPDFSSADNETGFPYTIVPNIVHMVHFGKPELNFGEMITIRSAYRNHKPDRIIIHCDCYNMSGQHWDLVKDIKVLEVMFRDKPEHIFGKKVSWIQHSSDIARLQILMEYGGIYLDSDVYVVKSLDEYRKFEFTVGWDYNQNIGNQVMIAHRKARFLSLYYDTYHNYKPDKWYYNGGELPTQSILYKKPYLVHRVANYFGVDTGLATMLYGKKTEEWRDFVTIHLLLRHKGYLVKSDPVKEFDMENIRTYNRTFGDMARLVIFGSTQIVV